MARLEIDSLAVDGVAPVSCILDEGQALLLRGPSGVGKTRLLRALADLEPHAGEIRLDGRRQVRIAPAEWRRRFAVTGFALLAVIGNRPWYAPQYAIPLVGMLIGNTMTGIALALDRLNAAAWEQREVIEGRLMLGFAASDAVAPLRREAARAGLMPAINAMAVAGLVFLPGTMTGQILAGAPPVEAVKYQILIMLIYAAGTGFGVIIAIWLGARRLFDARQRLRLERLLTAE